MIRHIVLFQFREELSAASKQEARERFKKKILALPEKLSLIRSIEVGFNSNLDEKWDICLNGLFENIDDVKTYATFPEHVAAARELKQFLSGRSCVDYEC